MEGNVVVDASAVLAEIYGEPGADVVREALPRASLSAVNLAEVVTGLINEGVPEQEADYFARHLSCVVEPADRDRAISTGLLSAATRRSGISLGDRFCLTLARELRQPVLTSDRRWASLDLDIEVRLIR
ncbi:MAG TPA: type II toxin-antitoxin system VapC family toxin [Caulobacteraceae bacterium]|nr:type II toxin-antitoxin system VapC family toxin [Caulobacteraceae bacterium]